MVGRKGDDLIVYDTLGMGRRSNVAVGITCDLQWDVKHWRLWWDICRMALCRFPRFSHSTFIIKFALHDLRVLVVPVACYIIFVHDILAL